MIDLIPPAVAREHYRLADYPFFIEFYLKSCESGKSLMSTLLPEIISHLVQAGIAEVAAVVNRQNIAVGKVLERAGFRRSRYFDAVQDIYLYSAFRNTHCGRGSSVMISMAR